MTTTLTEETITPWSDPIKDAVIGLAALGFNSFRIHEALSKQSGFNKTTRTIRRYIQDAIIEGSLEKKEPSKRTLRRWKEKGNQETEKPYWYYQQGIYFVSWSNDPDHIKIGKAERLGRRLLQYQTYNPHQLVVHGFVITDNADQVEDQIHKEMKELRVNGEWFRTSTKILEKITHNV